jgi:hypothetical protein
MVLVRINEVREFGFTTWPIMIFYWLNNTQNCIVSLTGNVAPFSYSHL